ncbi:VWA domain-containing protein [Candidatus Woesearchaeota archaeon]|nr:VWA domain-containing protein [Candidatus Woesearchaeota archaeon]
MLENSLRGIVRRYSTAAVKYATAGVLGLALLFGGKRMYAGDEGLDLPIGPRISYSDPHRQEPPRIPDEDPPTFFGEPIYGATESLIYVVDRSGSMERVMGSGVDLEGRVRNMTRFQRAQVELKRSIRALAPNFRFNIVSYDCSTNAWQRELVPASVENKRAAYRWIDGLYPQGGTGTAFGVSYALRTGGSNRDVILLTDGEPTCRLDMAEHLLIITNSNPDHDRVHVFGIATYGPFRQFCQRVASNTGGSFHEVR